MAKEYYEILGISENASADEIKKAYRKKAMEYHPDRNAGDKEKEAIFKKINEAYSVLSDPQKKQNYDRFGSAEGMGGFGWFGWGFQGGFDASDLGDIFSQFFGWGFSGNSRRKRADVGADIEIHMNISLEDALRGISRKVEYERNITCEHCDGKWWDRKTCEKCHGSGVVRERVQTVFGVMEQTRTCWECGWQGTIVTNACNHCGGSGKKSQKVEKIIEIPKGIEDGMSMKMRDEWHFGRDGNGDLYIVFSVANNYEWLLRKWEHLHFSVKISPAEAALGTKKKIAIPILWKKELDIRAGTQHNEEIIFKWEWMPNLDSSRMGNLIITLLIEIPKRLTADEKKLYEALLISEWWRPKKGWLEELFWG